MTTPTISVSAWSGRSLAGGIRLTARGRAAMIASMAALLVAVAVAAVLGSAVAAPTAVDAGIDAAVVVPAGTKFDGRPVVYTVQAGDTLWDLAVALSPGADPRPMVDEIQRLNGMAASSLSVGEHVLLPAVP